MMTIIRKMLLAVAISLPAFPAPAASQAEQSPRRVAADVGSVAEPRVTLHTGQIPLAQALSEIGQRTGIRIGYSPAVVPVQRLVSVDVEDVAVSEAVRRVLAGTGIQISRMGDGSLLLFRQPAELTTLQGTISGKILHAKTRQPIVGATVTLDGTSVSATTDATGAFQLRVEDGEYQLRVRAVGFVRQARSVTAVRNQAVAIEIILDPTASVMDEVIVTGTVVATARKEIPTPITVITAEDIERRGITRIEQLLRGDVPGVLALDRGSANYTEVGTGMMNTSSVYARGSASLSGEANPLKTFVDGVELQDSEQLGTIDPNSIERIEIITGPQAATIYGSGAMGGVMQIFTKSGGSRTAPTITLNTRYGLLESNLAAHLTPQHNHGLSATGGAGPIFSYSGTASYNYTGAWQPGLFMRSMGASAGVTHARGPLLVSGSVGVTNTTNGTFVGRIRYCAFNDPGNPCYSSVVTEDLRRTGDLAQNSGTFPQTQRISTSSGQTVSLNVDYRIGPMWQHHLTMGRNQMKSAIKPERPMFEDIRDSLYKIKSGLGDRTTLSYNMTILPRWRSLSSTMTLGTNGSFGDGVSVDGCVATESSTSYIGCYDGLNTMVTRSDSRDSWGGFGTWRIGVWNQLYLTLGVRAERNKAYGEKHKIDWTPNNGLAYTLEYRDMTVKLLGSYGRATRQPPPTARLEILTGSPDYIPGIWVSQAAALHLTPEYSRGPQVGIELYYGNRGSLTVNHYQQRITDLIQSVLIGYDTVIRRETGQETLFGVNQYQNVASVRQQGWEGTGSLNLGPLSLRGTYSWSDSRVTHINPGSSSAYGPGYTYRYLPTHTGSVMASYALHGTSVTVTSNWIGASIQQGGRSREGILRTSQARIRMYGDRVTSALPYDRAPGYAKANLTASHRLRSWVSATLNITNLTNSYVSDYGAFFPTLGRQTTIGVSLRNSVGR